MAQNKGINPAIQAIEYANCVTIYSSERMIYERKGKLELMAAQYQHIAYPFGKTFRIEKFDKDRLCSHHGLHFHDSYEIVYIKNGSGKVIVEDRALEYRDGVLALLGPCIPHLSFSNNQRPDNFEIVIHFDDHFVQEKIRLFPEFASLLPLLYKAKQLLVFSPEMHEQQSVVFEQVHALSPPEQLIALFKLLHSLSRAPLPTGLIKETVSQRYARNKEVRKIFDFINVNYHRPISTQDLASHIGLTTNSFCRMFKRLTGKPLITYLNEFRIHQATKLLEETDDTVSEIMYQCGFDNPSYFARRFTAIRGLSPASYRKKYRSDGGGEIVLQASNYNRKL